MESGGFQRTKKSRGKLTCPVGLVALGGQAGHAAAHVVDGDDAELIIHVRREAQRGRVDAAGIPGVVVPYSWLEAILLELHDVVWEEREGLGWGRDFSIIGKREGDFGDRPVMGLLLSSPGIHVSVTLLSARSDSSKSRGRSGRSVGMG